VRKLHFSIVFLVVLLIVFVSFGIGAGSRKGKSDKRAVPAIELKIKQIMKVADLPSGNPPEVFWAKDGQNFAYIERGGGEATKLWVSRRDGG